MKKIFTVLAMLCMVVGAMGSDALVSYTGKTYGIDYVLFEGQIAGTNPDQARYGEKFRVISPTRAGYTFAGWSVTRNLNTESAKWGVSEPDVAIDSTATRCGKGEPSVYFINLAGSESGRVTLTATWQVSETSSIDATLLYAIGDIVPRSSLTPSKMTLKAGDKVIMFPEGTRAAEGEDLEAKNGVAMIALKTGVPIFPIFIEPKKRWFRWTRVVYGEPFYPTCENKKPTDADYRRIGQEWKRRVEELGESIK